MGMKSRVKFLFQGLVCMLEERFGGSLAFYVVQSSNLMINLYDLGRVLFRCTSAFTDEGICTTSTH